MIGVTSPPRGQGHANRVFAVGTVIRDNVRAAPACIGCFAMWVRSGEKGRFAHWPIVIKLDSRLHRSLHRLRGCLDHLRRPALCRYRWPAVRARQACRLDTRAGGADGLERLCDCSGRRDIEELFERPGARTNYLDIVCQSTVMHGWRYKF